MTAPDLDAMLTREQCAEWLQVKPALVGRRCDEANTIDPSFQTRPFNGALSPTHDHSDTGKAGWRCR